LYALCERGEEYPERKGDVSLSVYRYRHQAKIAYEYKAPLVPPMAVSATLAIATTSASRSVPVMFLQAMAFSTPTYQKRKSVSGILRK
jgi:uncharacterized membrane protein